VSSPAIETVTAHRCGVCGQDDEAHDTCPECFHCPGYPHDHGCDGLSDSEENPR